MTDVPQDKKPLNYGDLPTNSKKAARKERPEKLNKIVTGNVIERKAPLGKRIRDSFTGDDSRSVGSYVFFEVVLPAIKQLISDAASQGVERLLFGESSRGSGARRGYTSYNRYSSTSGSPNSSTHKPNPRAVHDFNAIVLDNRGAAEEVIDALNELIGSYDVATVADLYELVGITGSYTDDKWGWTSMATARVERVRDGYYLNLPRTQPLD